MAWVSMGPVQGLAKPLSKHGEVMMQNNYQHISIMPCWTLNKTDKANKMAAVDRTVLQKIQIYWG